MTEPTITCLECGYPLSREDLYLHITVCEECFAAHLVGWQHEHLAPSPVGAAPRRDECGTEFEMVDCT